MYRDSFTLAHIVPRMLATVHQMRSLQSRLSSVVEVPDARKAQLWIRIDVRYGPEGGSQIKCKALHRRYQIPLAQTVRPPVIHLSYSTPGVAMAVNPSPDASTLSLESCKMDIVSCDVNVFEAQKHPKEAIRSLYFNAYNHLIRILSTHCSTIKSVAVRAVRMKQVVATEE